MHKLMPNLQLLVFCSDRNVKIIIKSPYLRVFIAWSHQIKYQEHINIYKLYSMYISIHFSIEFNIF